MPDRAFARRAMSCLDLTDLSDTASERSTGLICERAIAGRVAAVCLWPQWVSRAKARLAGTDVRIATVVNFPAGGTDAGRAADDACEALGDGAHEIDLVMPYRAFLEGRPVAAEDMIGTVRDVVDGGRVLKVILETGALGEASRIAEASRLAITAGADFIKTSTGNTPVSATPEAARIMLEAIRDCGRPVGIKPSGGIRTLDDARIYVDLADAIMGEGWATPRTFRIGASGLYAALAAELGASELG